MFCKKTFVMNREIINNESMADLSEIEMTQNVDKNMIIMDKNNSNFFVEIRNDEVQDILKKLCRFCLDIKSDMRSIFDDNCLSDIIQSITTIQQIHINDGLPAQICLKCINHVYRTLAFKQQIEFSDATLRHYISQGCFEGMKLIPLNYVENDSDFYKNIEHLKTIEVSDEIVIDNINLDENTKNSEIIENDNITEEFIISFPMNEIGEENRIANIEENGDIAKVNVHKTKNPRKRKMDENNLTRDHEDVTSEIKSEIKLDTNRTTRRRKHQINNHEYEDIDQYIKNDSSKFDDIESSDIDDSTKFSCKNCDKTFINQRRLNRHLRIHKLRKSYRCPICSKNFISLSDLSEHTKKKHVQLAESSKSFAFVCPECHTGFNIKSDLIIHSSIHSKDGKHICQHCKKECITSLQLKRHVRIHYVDKPHKCGICQKGFPEMGSLTRHYRRHTGEQREKKHLCNVCGKGYYDSHSLSIHTRTHTGERPWVCTMCGKGFIDSRLLNSHSKVHSGEKPHICHICKKSFTHHSTLTTHIRTHTGEKPYICSVCGKTFIQSSNLSLHMRVHSGEKPYECSICSRSFASSSTLTMHTRIHTGEKPYICTICNKRFARHDLSAHMRTHTGEKPFSCIYCSKKFTTTGQLNQHSRTHTGVKSFICNICKQCCSSSTYLKKHMRTHDNSIKTSDINHEEIDDKIKVIQKIDESYMNDDNNHINNNTISTTLANTPDGQTEITDNNIYANHNINNHLQDNRSRVFLTTSTRSLSLSRLTHSNNFDINDQLNSDINNKMHNSLAQLDIGNTVLTVNTNDLLSVVNNSNGLMTNVSIQVPILAGTSTSSFSSSNSNDIINNTCNTTTNLVSNALFSSLDGKYIYQAIDPSIMRIQHVHSAAHINVGETSK